MIKALRPVVTGATGFVGKQLCARLGAPRILTRRPEATLADFSQSACFRWNPESELPPPEALDDCDAVFHLAGEPVAEGRWDDDKKARIRDSRVLGTRNLVAGLRAMQDRPAVLVSASAVGIYGSRGDDVLTEGASQADGFLADVCREWEAEANAAESLGIRVVTIRIGLVLGAQGGALAKMIPLFNAFAGGRLGSGRQWMPWIHVQDLAALIQFSAELPGMRGPVNGSAPNPVTNKEFTRALAGALGRPAMLPAPAFALRLALGEFADVLLASQRVVPEKAKNAGFEFRYPTISAAFRTI